MAILVFIGIAYLLAVINEKYGRKKRINRMFTYVAVSFLFIFGMITSIPTVGATINLYRDFYKPVVLSTSGVVEDEFSIPTEKRSGIVVNDERYLISSFADRVSKGDVCSFAYLKNSRYIIFSEKEE
jgi:hypothetical protein